MGLGVLCTAPFNACSLPGVVACSDGEIPNCRPFTVPVENCNDVDDDCDGEIDEGDLGNNQDCELAWPGVCSRGKLTCVGGEFTCENRIAPATQVETCNGLDDDCDGLIDNHAFSTATAMHRMCYQGPANSGGIGACVQGTQTCDDSIWTGCVGQVLPTLEICDLIDNNCDGTADNVLAGACTCTPGATRSCYGGPEGTDDAAPCTAGSQTCGDETSGHEGQWGNCTGSVVPAVELCNTIDDDCDGTADEDAAGAGSLCLSNVPAEQLGICRREGEMACTAGALVCTFEGAATSPETELCNTLDDDCDGRTDEGPDGSKVGVACNVGVGACARTGSYACPNLDDAAVACNAVAGAPGTETCNGIDDDCNGTVDEGLGLGDACTVGVGACVRTGVKVCGVAGALACSVQPGGPTAEICDALDNDCDGTADEDLGVGNVCDGREGSGGGTSGCGLGVIECAYAGTTRCSTGLGGSAYPATSACTGAGSCSGYLECSPANTWICGTAAGGSGNPDGGVAGASCDCEECCTVGVWECGFSNVRCSTGPGGSTWTGGCE
jgi:hypothetical protein